MNPRWNATWLAASVALVVIGLSFGLHGYPLLDPDEGRNAEVAREMAETNGYVVPTLNGLPYLDKPILYFAIAGAFMEVLGPTPLAARLPSLLFTLGTLALVGWFAHAMFGAPAGWIAAAATGASPLTLGFARTVIFDSALTCFVVLALIAFYFAAEHVDRPEGRGWWCTWAWTGLALGVLTKGPIALILPLMVVLPYLAWRRRLRALWDPVAVLLFVALVLPWVVAMSREVPGFLDHALVTETWRRFTTDELRRTGPVWYFLPIVAAGALPWTLVVLGGLRRSLVRTPTGLDARFVFLALWVIVPLVFFSLSQSKRPQYVLPLMPAVGLLVAFLWTRDGDRPAGIRTAAAGLIVAGLVVLGAPWIVPSLLDVEPAIRRAIPRTAIGLGAACIAAGVVASMTRRVERALVALCVPVSAIPFVSLDLMRGIGEDRSAAAVAEAVQPLLTPSMQIIGIDTYPLSLPFYLRRTLLVTTDDGSELTSNFLIRTFDRWRRTPGSPFRPEDWWREALAQCTRPRLFVVHPENHDVRRVLDQHLPLIAESSKVAAYGPCGVSDLASRFR